MPLEQIDIIFDGPPDHEAGRFIEVEDRYGCSISVGEWLKLERDGHTYWALRLMADVPANARLPRDLADDELGDDDEIGFGERGD